MAPRTSAALLIAALAIPPVGGCGGSPLEDYRITAVELRSAPRLDFLRARRHMKFLQVLFEFENGSDEPITLKALDFSLRDTTGRLHPFSAQVLDMGQPKGAPTVTLEPDERRPGSVVFQVPTGADPFQMVFRQEVDGGLAVDLTPGGTSD